MTFSCSCIIIISEWAGGGAIAKVRVSRQLLEIWKKKDCPSVLERKQLLREKGQKKRKPRKFGGRKERMREKIKMLTEEKDQVMIRNTELAL